MESNPIITATKGAMDKAVEFMIQEFAGVRTGKASPALVEMIDIHVQSYGSSMKLKQLAMIRSPEPRLIVVEPFDPGTVQDIERGLRESKLGINPATEGKTIRLPFPELSEERRKDLVKMVKGMGENARISVRACRKEGIDKVKAAQKSSELSEDVMHDLEREIQTLTDDHVKTVDEHIKKKEEEVMTV